MLSWIASSLPRPRHRVGGIIEKGQVIKLSVAPEGPGLVSPFVCLKMYVMEKLKNKQTKFIPRTWLWSLLETEQIWGLLRTQGLCTAALTFS